MPEAVPPLSIKAVTGKPIKFVGMGEKLDNIEVFHPDRMASRILGMGDVLTLIEKAEQQFDQQKAQELAEKLKKNRFTLQDYYDQLVQVKGMGSVEELLGMMPGINAKALEGATINEKALTRTGGDHPLYDPSGAGEPLHPQQQPEETYRRRLWIAGGRRQPSSERVWYDAADDQTDEQTHRQAPEGKVGKLPGGFPGLPL